MTRQLIASEESEMLADNLAKVPDFSVIQSDTGDGKICLLSLSALSWLKSRILFKGTRDSLFFIVETDTTRKSYAMFARGGKGKREG